MEKLRSSAPAVGLAMGVFLVVVGLIQGSYGLVGLGVAVAAIGVVSRRTES